MVHPANSAFVPWLQSLGFAVTFQQSRWSEDDTPLCGVYGIPLIFGTTASHCLLWFWLSFFFPDFWPDGCVEPMRSDAFIHFYVASTSGWEFYCLFLNPHKYMHIPSTIYIDIYIVSHTYTNIQTYTFECVVVSIDLSNLFTTNNYVLLVWFDFRAYQS